MIAVRSHQKRLTHSSPRGEVCPLLWKVHHIAVFRVPCLQVALLYAGTAQNLQKGLQRHGRKLQRLRRSFERKRLAFDGTLKAIPALIANLRETAGRLLRMYAVRTGDKVTEDRLRSRP